MERLSLQPDQILHKQLVFVRAWGHFPSARMLIMKYTPQEAMVPHAPRNQLGRHVFEIVLVLRPRHELTPRTGAQELGISSALGIAL